MWKRPSSSRFIVFENTSFLGWPSAIAPPLRPSTKIQNCSEYMANINCHFILVYAALILGPAGSWLSYLICKAFYHTDSFLKFPPIPPQSILFVFTLFVVVFVICTCCNRFIQHYHDDVILFPVLKHSSTSCFWSVCSCFLKFSGEIFCCIWGWQW
jgi:hypothetical protein